MHTRRGIAGDVAKETKALYCTEHFCVNAMPTLAESLSTYPESSVDMLAKGEELPLAANGCSDAKRYSQKSAIRVLSSITKYIETELKLKVNQQKSKVSEPVLSALLGFSFYRSKDKWEIRIAGKSLQRIKQKCKDIRQRNNGSNTRQKLLKIAPVIRGWVNYFSIAKVKSVMQTLDECVRTRLRIGLWKEWKNCRTRVANLQNLGATK